MKTILDTESSEIWVGDRFLCIKDVVMDNGEKAYVKGKTYVSDMVNCITDESGCINHYWGCLNDIIENFVKVDDMKQRIVKALAYLNKSASEMWKDQLFTELLEYSENSGLYKMEFAIGLKFMQTYYIVEATSEGWKIVDKSAQNKTITTLEDVMHYVVMPMLSNES